MNWAKVKPPDVGTYSMPNVGDDVVIVFEKGDIDRPMALASSWNVKERPPEAPTPTNYTRVIQSREGHKITFDDTPGAGGISLESAAGAKIVLDGQGNVIIQSSKPGGKIEFKSDVKNSGEVTIDAQNVNVTVAGTMDVS
jgi:uncharacterized protein involved in type VI secretion and phage assembly